jgi:hypothetical protein
MKTSRTERYAASTQEQAIAAWEKDRVAAAAGHFHVVGAPRWVDGEARPTLEVDYEFVAPPPAFGPPLTAEPAVVRSYEGGSETAARELYAADRREMEAAGYRPVSETWSSTGIGRGTIVVLGSLAALAPEAGVLTVTYVRGSESPDTADQGH